MNAGLCRPNSPYGHATHIPQGTKWLISQQRKNKAASTTLFIFCSFFLLVLYALIDRVVRTTRQFASLFWFYLKSLIRVLFVHDKFKLL